MLRGRLPRRISVAPMVDVTGPPFLYLLRLISPHAHYQLYSEMIHANAFTRGKIMTHKPSLHQHIFVGDPHFKKAMTVQLGGYEEKAVSVASRYLAKELGVSEINLNVGCPSKNVQAGSFGAVLMKTPLQVASTCRAMEDAVDAKAEITVKCRIGVDHEESFDFVRRFVDTVASKTKVSHFIVHARRAWLKGLSPKDNLTAPPLNYPIVYQLANEYPDLKFTINGGIDDLDSIKGHLNFVDGVMMGRKIRDDPWFLTEMDTNLFGIGESSIPSREYVLDKYLGWADNARADFDIKPTILARPLNSIFTGKRGKAFRRHLGPLICDPAFKNKTNNTVQFSELVRESISRAENEHQDKNSCKTKMCHEYENDNDNNQKAQAYG